MPSISNWYNNQYSTWNRTRRLSTTPYLARTNTNTSRTATAMMRNSIAQEAVVVDMGDLGNISNNKKQDTLFGPNIGVVASGPAWTETNETKSAADQLTLDVVKGWITKSKEASQPTTTLQALVNLKRPTLRLSPLSPTSNDDPTQTDSHDHGLEFEYDCDAPKCGIYVHVLLSPNHYHGDSSDKAGLSRVLVFETVVEGGFGKILKLEEGATLQLGRFERHYTAPPEDTSVSNTGVDGRANTPGLSGVNDEAPRKNRRFTHFHFRKRDQDCEVAGPALAVVDAETNTAVMQGDKDKDSKDQVEDGVKVIIRLVALDHEGKPLSSPNEQATYLHVVRMGVVPVEGGDDLRPWVVKVVKREATIGPHTFHLHEIYGLSSQSSSSSKPVAPVPISPTTTEAESHTYPPTSTSPTLPTSAIVREEEPSSECLLCLSSPREVVLLPCRHLVACKDCALNMVEFGAGGNIVQPEEPVVPASGAAAEGAEGSNTEPITAAAAAPMAPIVANQARRKRKAKGWFCPVCRQPYTSLLRITTTPPAKEKDIDKRTSTSTEGVELAALAATTAAALTPTNTSRGALASLRPAFLRGVSRSSTSASADPTQPAPTLPPDLERGEARLA